MRIDRVILKNITSLFSIRIAGYVIPLVTLPYLVKVLEPVGYGLLSFGIAILQYYILIVSYGFDLSATRKIAQNKLDKIYISTIFWNVMALRVLISIIGLIVLLITINIIDELKVISEILLAGYLSVLGVALFPMWLFQGKEQLGKISTARIILQIICIPLFFIFVTKSSDTWLASFIYALPQFFIAIISSFIIYKRKWICFTKITFLGMRKELADGWHLFISTAAISLYTTTVTVVLGFVSGPYSVAIYTSANKLLQAAQGLYQPISSAFYPRISGLMKENPTIGFKTIRKLFIFQMYITGFISVCLFVFSDFAVTLLFGEKYIEAAFILKVLSSIPVIVGCSNILGIQTLLTCGYKKEFSKVLMLSGLLNMLMIYPACIMFNGVGAALAVLLTELFVTTLMFYFVIKLKIPIWR